MGAVSRRLALTVVVSATAALATIPGAAAGTSAPSKACPAPPSGLQTHTPTVEKSVALTFDDGPGPQTAQILGILARNGVRATFFNEGVQMHAHPELVRAEAAEGHTLGNHTWDHPQMSTLSAADQAVEIDRTSAEQLAIVGTTPCVFRPPYGDYDDDTLSVANARGMSVWNWSASTQDWMANGSTDPSWVDHIVTRAEAGARGNHTVILMHNAAAPGDPATVIALPTIIGYFRSHGFTFVDVLGRHGLAAYAPVGAPAPTAAVTGSGVHVFTRDARGRIAERTHQGSSWSGPRLIAGSTSFAPSAARLSSTTALLAVTDRRGHVLVRNVRDLSLGRWADLGGSAAGRPAVTVAPDGTIAVVVRRPDGTLAYRQRVHGSWRAWHRLAGVVAASDPAAAAVGSRLTVVAADSTGSVRLRQRTVSGWQPWRTTGLTTTADPALVMFGSGLALATRSDTGATVVSTAGAGAARWSAAMDLGGVAFSGPAMTVTAARLSIFAVDGGGRLRQRRAQAATVPSSWTAWHPVP